MFGSGTADSPSEFRIFSAMLSNGQVRARFRMIEMSSRDNSKKILFFELLNIELHSRGGSKTLISLASFYSASICSFCCCFEN